jgi:hypothetical protein
LFGVLGMTFVRGWLGMTVRVGGVNPTPLSAYVIPTSFAYVIPTLRSALAIMIR